jgi:hypothetical protein
MVIHCSTENTNHNTCSYPSIHTLSPIIFFKNAHRETNIDQFLLHKGKMLWTLIKQWMPQKGTLLLELFTSRCLILHVSFFKKSNISLLQWYYTKYYVQIRQIHVFIVLMRGQYEVHILAKISNAPLLHLKNFKTMSEFTINWYWYHLSFTQLNCQGPKNCNQVCSYSTVTVIVEKHVERFPPIFWVHLLKITYPHVL